MLAIVGGRVLISAAIDRLRDVEEFIISICDDFSGEISGNKIINIIMVFSPKTTQLFPTYIRYACYIVLNYYDRIGANEICVNYICTHYNIIYTQLLSKSRTYFYNAFIRTDRLSVNVIIIICML